MARFRPRNGEGRDATLGPDQPIGTSAIQLDAIVSQTTDIALLPAGDPNVSGLAEKHGPFQEQTCAEQPDAAGEQIQAFAESVKKAFYASMTVASEMARRFKADKP